MAELRDVRIHPSAEVAADAEIGDGTSIWHWVQIRERAQIGRECVIGKGAYIDHSVIVGDRCKIQNGAYLYHPAILGEGVFIGPGVILTNDLRPRAVNPDMSIKTADDWTARPVAIADGAALGAGSIVLPGIRVGAWAMVGSGAVVTRDIPDYGLVLGNPGRFAGYVCRCGERLLEVADSEFRCQECGREYQKFGGGIKLRVS